MPNFKLEAKVQLWIFLGPAVVGFVVALILPGKDPLALLTIAIAMAGAWQILKSKLSLKSRTHIAKEWGSKNMSNRERLRLPANKKRTRLL